MSATYITTTGFLKKKTVFIREAEIQTLNSLPVIILDADLINNFIVVSAFLHGAPNATPGTAIFNNLYLTDGNPGTIFQARCNTQLISGGSISTLGGYVFSCGTYFNGANGGLTFNARPLVLTANADDPTATGDYELIVIYYEIPA